MMRQLLILLSVFVLVACAEQNIDAQSGTGSIAPSVIWVNSDQQSEISASIPAGITVGPGTTLPADLVTVRLIVTGTDILDPIIGVYTASTRTGTVSGVPAGSDRTVTVQGLNISDEVIYEGILTNVLVESGSVTQVTITAIEIVLPGLRDSALLTFYAESSWFTMDTSTPTPISMFNGIILNVAQDASGSHSGDIDGTENPNIDNPWYFIGATGLHKTTTTGIMIQSGDNGADDGIATLDFSDWAMEWNGVEAPIGGIATLNCYTTLELRDAAGIPDGVCNPGEYYMLEFSTTIPEGSFAGTLYTLHLEGLIEDTLIPEL